MRNMSVLVFCPCHTQKMILFWLTKLSIDYYFNWTFVQFVCNDCCIAVSLGFLILVYFVLFTQEK
jgi:hypothetical protein